MQPQYGSDEGAVERTKAAAGEVAGTAKDQAMAVTKEAGTQMRQVTDQTRRRLADEARTQADRASGQLRGWSEELSSMAESSKPDSPVHGAVNQLADTGRRAADYLDQNGIEGALGEVQEFARRKPGMFLLGAAVAGFLIGRAAKATVQGDSPQSSPQTDSPRTTPPQVTSGVSERYVAPEPTFGQESAYMPGDSAPPAPAPPAYAAERPYPPAPGGVG